MEHYVTVFDSNFILAGLALHDSLKRHCEPFTLWILGLDDEVLGRLGRLDLPDVRLIPMSEIETPELLAVKGGRTRGEYCWTLTPFLPEVVMRLCPEALRVTYLDADLYFFDSAREIFGEFDRSGKDVLITDHAYGPGYDLSARSGRFCVQFMVFRATAASRAVLHWWQQKCVEWCFARYEPGRFGDQKYLDVWPEIFAQEVHVLQQTDLTVAPWNVQFFSLSGPVRPVFFHFQGFRILSGRRVKLFHGYRVGRRNLWIYREYLAAIVRGATRLKSLGYEAPRMPEHRQSFRLLKYALMTLAGYMRFARVRL